MADCVNPNLDLAIVVAAMFGVLVIIALWATIWFERRSWKRSHAPLTEEEARWFNAQVEQLEVRHDLEMRAREAWEELNDDGHKLEEEKSKS
ncbi:hypothetical protein BMI86_16385 [Thioclava sp. DLFJ5-1]|uniref:hypothetical protein n=1 Tax=Thioclava TaxID=285107 RepID=UPI0009984301|nr:MULTISPECIES: hypothetical protein [Thioclava]MAQ38156.1 hypothetical protein [Thioclava sp.]OOY07089.1 hypothetical protein BMI89_19420 [Thioclava sp. F36-7]OOY19389.1 hypothetical protein BMI86_16385 [Thioclava sp. DLFJ5-1]|tara:strand:- start:482 stop:757 length:276 start_codon:yes stop_codon:yes gene_type:complete